MDVYDIIVDFHSNTLRQGPGSYDNTLKALSFIENLNSFINIADIGCGTGASTITLAHNTNANIYAVDLSTKFVDKLNNIIFEEGFNDRIKTFNNSMDYLPFTENMFDLIWSEGAIYNIGFKNGIELWKKFLKPNGYMAITEISYLTEKRPDELTNYWNHFYNEIDTISNKIKILEHCGYKIISAFKIPDECWTVHYYNHLEQNFESFLEKNNHSQLVIDFVDEYKQEINIFKKFSNYFGYVFYIVQKIDDI